jgi:hypothetical protein
VGLPLPVFEKLTSKLPVFEKLTSITTFCVAVETNVDTAVACDVLR